VRDSIREAEVMQTEDLSREEMITKAQKELRIYRSSIDDRKKLASVFVTEASAIDLIESIEQIGSANRIAVNITSVERSDISKALISEMALGALSNMATSTFSGVIIAKVSIQGSWSLVMNTLVNLESLPFISFLDRVRIDVMPAESGNRIKMWRLSVDVISPIYRGLSSK
jgi:hypothetical protein